MRLGQLFAGNEEANEQAQPCEGHIEDEHGPQRIPVRTLCDAALGLRQGLYLVDARLGIVARQQVGNFVAQFLAEPIGLGRHAGREDDAANDDGDGCRELADEHEGTRRAGNVARLDGGLQRDQGRLEVGPDTHAEDDLEANDLGPVRGRAEVDEEAVA